MTARNPEPMRRRDFDALSAADRAAHIHAGGTVFDPPAPPQAPVFLARSEFDRMPEQGRRLFIERGGLIYADALEVPALSIAAETFDALPPAERQKFVERGGLIEGRRPAGEEGAQP